MLKTRPRRGMFSIFLISALLAVGAALASAQIVLNEVLADPARDWDGDGVTDFRQDEWVEILNRGSAPVDLTDYWLRDDSSREPDFPLSGVLPPGQVKVIFGSEVMAWQTANGRNEVGFGLNNSGDRVFLMYGAHNDELIYDILDQVWIGNHVADDDRSLGRDPDTGLWRLNDGWHPYAGSESPPGSGCIPTPGQANLCDGVVADEPMSWGTVKSTYR